MANVRKLLSLIIIACALTAGVHAQQKAKQPVITNMTAGGDAPVWVTFSLGANGANANIGEWDTRASTFR